MLAKPGAGEERPGHVEVGGVPAVLDRCRCFENHCGSAVGGGEVGNGGDVGVKIEAVLLGAVVSVLSGMGTLHWMNYDGSV